MTHGLRHQRPYGETAGDRQDIPANSNGTRYYMWAIKMSPISPYNGDTTYKHHVQSPEHC